MVPKGPGSIIRKLVEIKNYAYHADIVGKIIRHPIEQDK